MNNENIELIKNFSENVKFLVKQKKLSRQFFLNSLKLSTSSFVNWDKQKSLPSADVIIKIASYFNIEPKKLIYENLTTSQNTTNNNTNYSDINFNGIMKRVDILIKKNNVSQKELSDAIGITSSAFSGLRKTNGIPNAITAWKIANYFNVSTDWLITGKKRKTKTDENKLVLETLINDLEDLKTKIQLLK